jgi:hypothetical protein
MLKMFVLALTIFFKIYLLNTNKFVYKIRKFENIKFTTSYFNWLFDMTELYIVYSKISHIFN